MPKLKTTAQNRAIFGLAAKRKCAHEDLRELAYDVTHGRTDEISKLTFDEANGMISRLGGTAFGAEGRPRRTTNYHKQKTQVETLVSRAQLEKLQQLADGRGMSNEGLRNLCVRMLKVEKPRTSKECIKVIEAIKAMNQRDRTFGAFTKEAA